MSSQRMPRFIESAIFSRRRSAQSLSVFCVLVLCTSQSRAAEDAVTFDAPSLVATQVLDGDLAHTTLPTQKTIQVVIPVTTQVQLSDRSNIKEFRFEVFWNRSVYPICDYAPKTRTTSEIEGLIDVDESNSQKSSLGISLSSGYQDVVKGTGNAELGSQNSSKRHYQEVPQHEVLVASGTIRRGTGAFFRFHPSRTETLEGGRDLVVAFQVPQSWRGGLLQIECHVVGDRKVFGGWSESFEHSRVFILPIYIEGDDQARESATEFVRKEQNLRRKWSGYRPPETTNVFGSFQSAFVSSRGSLAKLPKDWLHHLIQGSDANLEKYRRQLPTEIVNTADEFVIARANLVMLSR